MLKKLLKYDFKAAFKYWWIAALSTFVLSFAGGGCITVLRSEKELPLAVSVLSTIAIILVALSYVAFLIFVASPYFYKILQKLFYR